MCMPYTCSLKDLITFMLISGKTKVILLHRYTERVGTGVRLIFDLGLWGPCTFCTQLTKKQHEISPESIYNSF